VNATGTVRTYYDALRGGDPLGPFFADGEPTVKYGVSERLVGLDAVRTGLAAQTGTTTDWTVESRALRVTERARHAWFSDDVRLAWTDAERGVRREYDTRWSGTLERRDGDATSGDDPAGAGTAADAGTTEGETGTWRFVAMHVSVARDLDGDS
jgi:hypothetical protein